MICDKKIDDVLTNLNGDGDGVPAAVELICKMREEINKQTNRANQNSSNYIMAGLREQDYLKIIRDFCLAENPKAKNLQNNMKDGFWRNHLSKEHSEAWEALVDFRDGLEDDGAEELISHIQKILLLVRINTITLFGLEKFNC